MIHHAPLSLLDQRFHVRLIGCGGNGSLMLTGLARLDHALRACDRPGFRVAAHDPDEVSPANVGRQMFAPGDVGRNKATVSIHRLNAFFGLDWYAEPAAFNFTDKATDILVSCVDTRAARAEINHAVTQASGGFGRSSRGPIYWMDLGNRASDGQVVLGQPAQTKKFRADKNRLPTVAELFHEIIKGGREDNAPSCSLAEALEKQHLFVNQAVVTPALQILWQLFRFGQIEWHGAFVNLTTGRVNPLPVDPEAWARLGHHAPPASKRTPHGKRKR